MAFAEHLVALRRDTGGPSLLDHERAARLWQCLRTNFPRALCCALMEEHLHLVAGCGQARRLRALLGDFGREFEMQFQVTIQVANSREIAFRAVRYTLLNPVRANLVHDAFSWPWSTLRDLAGAAYPVWTPASNLANALNRSPASLLKSLTHTADSRPPLPQQLAQPVASLDMVQHAVASALRVTRQAVLESRLGRRLTVQACYELGCASSPMLARHLQISVRAVRYLRTPRHEALDAVMRCICDARFCVSEVPPRHGFRKAT